MRISTSTLFDTGAARIGDLQTSLARIQQQLATGKRVLVPSDDPVAASQALELTQAQAMNSQFGTNRKNAENGLDIEEKALQNVTELLQDLKTKVIEAGNGSLDNTQRSFIATELEGRLSDLLGLANTTDGTGGYIFAGFQTTTQPFVRTVAGAQYNGDQGTRTLQVGPLRVLEVGDNGASVFERSRTGNGVFATSAAAANIGSGVISTGSVVDSTLLTRDNYTITFTSATTYDIVDTTAGTAVSSGNTYVSGQAISFDGLQIQISGSPAANDTFDVVPSSNQSVFNALTDLINVLKTPVTNAKEQADLSNGLRAAHNLIGSTLDNVMTVRASVGSRLKEVDALNTQGDDRDIEYAQSLAALQDLDYTKAVTDMTKQKIMLEALQQSFAQTSSLSLFKYI